MQRRIRRDEIEMHLQISADELPLLREALSEQWDNAPASDSTDTSSAVDSMCTFTETASSSNNDNENSELPVDLIMSAISEIKTDMKEIKSDMQTIMASQKALCESVKYIYSVIAPKSVAQCQLTTPPVSTPSSSQRPSHSGSTSSTPHRRPTQAVTPMYISSTENTYLLGGVDGLHRALADYITALRKVVSRAASKPEAMGRMMCSILVRMEFSDDDLVQKNVTGKTRDSVTKKLIDIPKLDTKIMDAIFRQAKLQFSGFSDNVSDSGCQTVKLINDTCKHMRQKSVAQQQ